MGGFRSAAVMTGMCVLFLLLLGQPAGAKTKWGDANPNPGWDKYYAGKCDELVRCTEAGDLRCLESSGIPLCNLEVQQTGIDKPWQKVLGLAAAEGQLEVVKHFVLSPLRWWDMHAAVNDSGENVLHAAAAHGEHKIVQWLMEQGADARTTSDVGETAMDLAQGSQYPARTVGVLQKFAEKSTERLVAALRTNSGLKYEQMQSLLKGGADLTFVDEETQLTPLGLAVKNGIVEAADELLKANAPLSRVHPRTGHDILHMACDSGQYQLVDLIVEHGKKRQIDVVSSTTLQFEMTCLHLAAMNGRNGIAHLMLEAGTDVNALDWEGESALLKFARQVYGGGTAQAGLFARFMEKGADPNVRDKDGHTALFYAIDHNQPAATKILVEGGADTATVSTKVDQTTGQTVDVGAFEMAVSSGAREVAAWLVTSGRREKFTHTSLKGSRGQQPRNPDGFAALTDQAAVLCCWSRWSAVPAVRGGAAGLAGRRARDAQGRRRRRGRQRSEQGRLDRAVRRIAEGAWCVQRPYSVRLLWKIFWGACG